MPEAPRLLRARSVFATEQCQFGSGTYTCLFVYSRGAQASRSTTLAVLANVFSLQDATECVSGVIIVFPVSSALTGAVSSACSMLTQHLLSGCLSESCHCFFHASTGKRVPRPHPPLPFHSPIGQVMPSRHPRLAGRPDRELPSLFESALFYRLRSPLGNLCPFFQHDAPFHYLTIGRLSRKFF